jgi:hypothetical protein
LRRHWTAHSGNVILRDAVRLRIKKCRAVAWQTTGTRALGPTCAADVGQTSHSAGASATKHPSHGSMRGFKVSCLMNTLIGKAFEDVGRIENVTQQLLQMHQAD